MCYIFEISLRLVLPFSAFSFINNTFLWTFVLFVQSAKYLIFEKALALGEYLLYKIYKELLHEIFL